MFGNEVEKTMRRLTLRIAWPCSCFALLLASALLPCPARAQSVWDKIKQKAKQAEQQAGGQQGQTQGQQGQQPQSQQGQQPATGQPQAQQGQQSQQPKGQAQSGSKGGQVPQSGINEDQPFTLPGDMKLDSVLVAPFQQGVPFAVSPHGMHVTMPSHAGSRQTVLYDGQPGPKYDQLSLISGPSPVAFSPDGNRWAYCGQVGGEWSVMVDGKEFWRGSNAISGGGDACGIRFTSNSKHVYYKMVVPDPKNSSGPLYSFTFDGKSIPATSDPQPAFSPDGDHYAVLWIEPDNNNISTLHYQLYVDGQKAPYTAGTPQWTGDSKHLYTQRPINGPNGSQIGVEVLLDGKPLFRANGNVTLYMAPVTDLAIAIVRENINSINNTSYLVVGGKKVPGSERTTSGEVLGEMVFSPDGKHYAVRYGGTNSNNRNWQFIDGVKGTEYQGFSGLGTGMPANNSSVGFTKDSSKSIYVGISGGNNFLVFGGQETDNPVPTFAEGTASDKGGHYLAAGWGVVTLDGKILKLPGVAPNTDQASLLGFSPDGTHYAFAVRQRATTTLYLDGVAQTDCLPASLGPMSNIMSRGYQFSPDSKHFAYFCRPSSPSAGNDVYLCMDGKIVRLGGAIVPSYLTFTADSNHILWTVSRPGGADRVFIDGKPIFEGFGRLAEETWQPGPDPSSWMFLKQDTDGLKRFTITPAAGSSFASFIGASTTISAQK